MKGLTLSKSLSPSVPPFAIECSMTDPPPAETPWIVTRDLSPPNRWMFFCIHSRENLWSSKPAFKAPPVFTSSDDKNPKAPSYKGLDVLDVIPYKECTHSVIHGDCKKLVSVGVDKCRKVIAPVCLAIPSAVNPDIDREISGPARSIDIQKQTVLVFFCSERWPCRNVASSG